MGKDNYIERQHMAELCIMIEGQMGLNWERWQRICSAVEELGFDGLFRSDHYRNPEPEYEDSLELWTSLTYAASHTKRIFFGPLVTPITFRHPTMLAKVATAVDDLSGGRLVFGIGAGWNEREHVAFGVPFPHTGERFARLEEALQLIRLLFRSEEPVSFQGQYYSLKEALLLPRPKRAGGPPILIGGNGIKRTLPLVAKYADEWNAVYLTPEDYQLRRGHLNGYLAAQNRSPKNMKYSMMTGLHFAKDDAALKGVLEKIRARRPDTNNLSDLELAVFIRQRGPLLGTPTAIIDQIGKLVDCGLSRLMVQWLDLDDLEGMEAFAARVLPQVRRM